MRIRAKLSPREIVVPPHTYQQNKRLIEAMNTLGLKMRNMGGPMMFKTGGPAENLNRIRRWIDEMNLNDRERAILYKRLGISAKGKNMGGPMYYADGGSDKVFEGPRGGTYILKDGEWYQTIGPAGNQLEMKVTDSSVIEWLDNEYKGVTREGHTLLDATPGTDGQITDADLPSEYQGKEEFRVIPGSPQYKQLEAHPAYELYREVGGVAIFRVNPEKAWELDRALNEKKLGSPEGVIEQYNDGTLTVEEAMSRLQDLGYSKLKARTSLGIKAGEYGTVLGTGEGTDYSGSLVAMPDSVRGRSAAGEATLETTASEDVRGGAAGTVLKAYKDGEMTREEAEGNLAQILGISRLKARTMLGEEAVASARVEDQSGMSYGDSLVAMPDSARGRGFSGVSGEGDLAEYERILGVTHGEGSLGSEGTDIDLPEFVGEDGEVVKLTTEKFRFRGPEGEPPTQDPTTVAVGVQAMNEDTGEVWEAQ